MWRVGHQPPQVCAATADEAVFVSALLGGLALPPALESWDLDFSTWLPQAVQQGLVLGVEALSSQG